MPRGRGSAFSLQVARRSRYSTSRAGFYVTDDDCTHGLSSLAKDGQVQGHEIECGWHGGRFNILTGEATGAPSVIHLHTYVVEVVRQEVFAVID